MKEEIVSPTSSASSSSPIPEDDLKENSLSLAILTNLHDDTFEPDLNPEQTAQILNPNRQEGDCVDDEAEDTMQSAIDTDFASHTVLAVMHRLRHIEWYDRVAVLEKGVLIEFGSPCDSLPRHSRFWTLWESGK
ncbi:hypothetical protein BDV06DRAFT_218106 [Aspergillus oleicola]